MQSVRALKDHAPYCKVLLVKQESAARSDGLKDIFLSPICVLLICFPLGIASKFCGWGDAATFWLNFFAMIPLAKILGDATEELAANLKNDMISGLLNATFGNAVEMIMTVALLQKHEFLVVKTTLVGSVLSNMLLVLGMSFFCGGLTRPSGASGNSAGNTAPLLESEAATSPPTLMDRELKYSPMGALVNTTMLLLACFTLNLVTIFNSVDNVDSRDNPTGESALYMLPISRACSVLIMTSYVSFIIFQLVTHKNAMGEIEGDAEEENEEEASLSLGLSLGLLFGATCVVAIASEFLTGALEGALEGSGLGKAFVGVILLPIVGNACEHAAAIRFAIQDKAGLSVGIAVGSSVQIALFVAPLSVIIGWAMGDYNGINMDLNFGALDCTVMTLSVLIILAIVSNGKATWLEGQLLMTAYAVTGVLYYFLPNPP